MLEYYKNISYILILNIIASTGDKLQVKTLQQNGIENQNFQFKNKSNDTQYQNHQTQFTPLCVGRLLPNAKRCHHKFSQVTNDRIIESGRDRERALTSGEYSPSSAPHHLGRRSSRDENILPIHCQQAEPPEGGVSNRSVTSGLALRSATQMEE